MLDKYHYDYELHSRKKSNQITVYINTGSNRFRISDRKAGKTARITIPKTHFLAKNYQKYNGFLENENLGLNPEVKECNTGLYVFFRPDDFEDVIKEIYK